MALKKMIKAPKAPRKPKMTRSAVKSIDDKYYGSEPLDVTEKGYTSALNWYNYMYEQEQAREWLLEYLKKNYTKDIVSAVRRVPKHRVPTTVGWISRMLMNGNKLQDTSMEFLKTRVDELVTMGKLIKEETPVVAAEKPTVSIQERTQAKIQLLLTECEAAVDEDSNLNIYEWLKKVEATPMAASAIRDYYANWIADFEYEDEFATRAEKKTNAEKLKYWTQFVDDCDRYIGNKKVTKIRKPREKKVKSAVDQVSKLKYQKEFPQLKIVSVNPAEIVGCQQLWTYNTKYKKMSRYDASGPNGIQVKGTTLIGYDVEKSSTKALRKPDITIHALLGAGKVALRKILDDLKTNETKPNGRINSDTILLRVVK